MSSRLPSRTSTSRPSTAKANLAPLGPATRAENPLLKRTEWSLQPAAPAARRGRSPMGLDSENMLGKPKPVRENSSSRTAFGALGRRGPVAALANITNLMAGGRSLEDAPVVDHHIFRDDELEGAMAPATEMMPEERSAPVLKGLNPDNTQDVAEYSVDICKKLFATEADHMTMITFLDGQPEITPNMRAILYDWLIEVHMKQNMVPETLHLAKNLVDRYLSKKNVTRRHLQLVGVSAMFIASKFEEIHPPQIDFWVYIAANAYTKKDILEMECTMLAALNFEIVVPTVAHFLPVFKKAQECDDVQGFLIDYLIELSMLDIAALEFTPSQLAAGATMLSNMLMQRRPVWSPTMVETTKLNTNDLRPCTDLLRSLFDKDRATSEPTLKAIRKKYSHAKREQVAIATF